NTQAGTPTPPRMSSAIAPYSTLRVASDCSPSLTGLRYLVENHSQRSAQRKRLSAPLTNTQVVLVRVGQPESVPRMAWDDVDVEMVDFLVRRVVVLKQRRAGRIERLADRHADLSRKVVQVGEERGICIDQSCYMAYGDHEHVPPVVFSL